LESFTESSARDESYPYAHGKWGPAALIAAVRREIEHSLQHRDLPEAFSLARQYLLRPAVLPPWADWFETVFTKAGYLDQVVPLLWDERETLLQDMFALGFFIRLCNKAKRYEEFRSAFGGWVDGRTAGFTIPPYAQLWTFGDLLPEQKADFCKAKYRDFHVNGSPEFFGAIEKLAEKVVVPPSLAQYLFDLRLNSDISYSQWVHQVRMCQSMNHAWIDSRVSANQNGGATAGRFVHCPNIAKLVDGKEVRSLFDTLDAGTGMLLATFHGGYHALAFSCFAQFCRRGTVMQRGQSPNQISVTASRDTAAFQAIKVLQKSGILLMAADAFAKTQFSKVHLLGLDVKLADGAPMIAYESRCSTGFYTLLRDGDRFIPVINEGPSAQPGEKFRDFKDRWWNFYVAEVENTYRQAPCNIMPEGP